jgi:preprotein translocase SecE subunit
MPAAVTKFATDIRSGLVGTGDFLVAVRAEMRKITWPDRVQLRKNTFAVIVFVLLIAGFIALLDVILQGVLVAGVPSLFK